MLSRYLKKTLVFSVAAAGILLFVLSCDHPLNPFNNNLGGKVDVEPPTVRDVKPTSGAFLKETATFTGLATAYRKLENVEVKILNPNEAIKEPLLDWTPVVLGDGDAKQKTWTYALDTLTFNGTGLDDGFLYIQFRASDPNLTAETVTLVYIIKNKPSLVKLTTPDSSRLVNTDGSINLLSPPKLGANTEILGNVIDRRGIKPGYPRIKFWPDELPEPADDDLNWGWAQLYLSGVDKYDYDTAEFSYADRDSMKVLNAANFAFKLADYTIDPDTRQIQYKVEGGGLVALPVAEYRFRIETWDTFFNDDVNSKEYMWPRDPDLEKGEAEVGGQWPAQGEIAYKIAVVSTGVRPEVDLDFSDINPVPPEPHIYVTGPTAKKIVVGGTDRADGADERKDFRLRVLARHPAGIARAILQWEHTGAEYRTGYLEWDEKYDEDDLNSRSLGYVDNSTPAKRAEEGHRGAEKILGSIADGNVFQFTAMNGMTYKDGLVDKPIFTSSTEPYTLTVTAYSTGDDTSTTQKYTLYLDGNGPEVNIRSIRGAFSSPSGDPAAAPGGTVNVNSYTVNGNIQVSIDRSASMGIMEGMVKWVVETKDYLDPTSLYHKLTKFRSDPTAYNALAFLDDLGADSGLVQQGNPPTVGDFPEDRTHNFKLNVTKWDGRDVWLYVIAQDGVYNLGYAVQKLKVDEGTDMPLLAPSGLGADNEPQNIGTAGDPEWVTINNTDKLYIHLDSDNKPLQAKKVNVLSRDQGIELQFSDDDGILPSQVKIELTSDNFSKKVTIPVSVAGGLVGNNTVLREWNGILSQRLMADVLFAQLWTDLETKLNQNSSLTDEEKKEEQDKLKALFGFENENSTKYLPDGVYTISIEVPDHFESKVRGTGLPQPVSVKTDRTIHFAVYSQAPVITPDNPREENSMQSKADTRIYGTVSSRLKIQKLMASFTPDITLPSPITGTKTIQVDLYADGTRDADGNFNGEVLGNPYTTNPLSVTPDANGDYIYYWSVEVNFEGSSVADNMTRRFNLQTWDGLSEQGVVNRSAQIDTTPPTVELVAFNFDRDYQIPGTTRTDNRVNGKVPIEINVSDDNGIGSDILTGANGTAAPTDKVYIKWFVLPSGDAAPTWDTTISGNSRGGQLTYADNIGGSRYRVFLDTTTPGMQEGITYNLYVIAEDKANNCTVDSAASPPRVATSLAAFTVEQFSDRPYVRSMEPASGDNNVLGGQSTLALTGSIYDDDGFAFGVNNVAANTYVWIRYRQNIENTGGWGDWIPVIDCKVDNATGYLDYTYPLTGSSYFNQDGVKQYQLRVIDEVARGTGPDLWGYYSPEGKNPDAYDNDGNEITEKLTIKAVGDGEGIILPGNNTWYSFMLKNTDPDVFFTNNDPNACHRIGHAYDSSHNHTNPQGAEYVAAPADVRPTFSTKGELLAALVGRIEEISLYDVTFTYGNSGTEQVVRCSNYNDATDPATGKPIGCKEHTSHPWKAEEGWLAPFDTASDGMNSITIRAADTIGNFTNAQWSFYKDRAGPVISFDNVSRGSIMTITGDGPVNGEPQIFVTGQFNDVYSNIGYAPNYQVPSFQYKLYRVTDAVPSVWTPAGIVATGGTVDGTSATWKVAIPGTYTNDGMYRFQIQVSDARGNGTTVGDSSGTNNGPIEFIVDRANPDMVTKANGTATTNRIIVKPPSGGTLSGVPTAGAFLAANQRVFSAANAGPNTPGSPSSSDYNASSVAPVFTLSGLVYEHNMDVLNAAIRNRSTSVVSVSLVGIDRSPVAWKNSATTTAWFYGYASSDPANSNYGTALTSSGNTLRVRRAAAGDFGLSGTNVETYRNRYVWELDILIKDFYALIYNLDSTMLVDNDSVTRSIAVTARDLAKKDSDADSWEFKLDSQAPKISFSNVDQQTGSNGTYTKITTLEDASVTLSGTAEDATKIRSIEYSIQRFSYSTDAWTTVGTEWRPYTVNQDRELETWNITNALSGNALNVEGLYRLSVRASDFSLSATAAGNLSNPVESREFYIDRTDPEIKWGVDSTVSPSVTYGTTLQSFYKWNRNPTVSGNPMNYLKFEFTVIDNSTIDTATWKLHPFGDSSTTTLSGDVTLTTPSATSTKASVELTDANWNDTNNKIKNGRYTLSLTIRDKAGHQASINQTVNFYLDNTKPVISVDPADANEAITGRVVFRGSFKKDNPDSPVARVLYKVSTSAVSDSAVTDANGVVWDIATLTGTGANGGWRYNDGSGSSPSKLTTGSGNTAVDLMEINQGLASANLLLYDTRRFLNGTTPLAGLLGSTETAGTDITFSSINNRTGSTAGPGQPPNGTNKIVGNPVYLKADGTTDANVNKLTIHFLAIDEAGNHQIKTCDYWVYPAGDIPMVTLTNPNETDTEVNRQLNGTIRVSGGATDNFRVQKVWFRVLKDGYNGQHSDNTVPVGYEPAALTIPVWDSFGNATETNQTATTLSAATYGTNHGTGWYIANGSGPGSISWWAQINNRGELDPGITTSRGIIIQAMAEDTIWVDSLNNNNGDYAGTGILSPLKPVTASVVSGAPRFEDERILVGANSSVGTGGNAVSPLVGTWGTLLTSAVSGIASYSVTVKHDSGVGSIRWTDPIAALGVNTYGNITATKNLLEITDAEYTAQVSAISTNGIAIKARPKKTETNLLANRTYMIWDVGSYTWANIGLKGGGTLGANNGQRYTIFTPSADITLTGGSTALLRTDTFASDNTVTEVGSFEWVVIVDLDSRVLKDKAGTSFDNRADYYPMNFESSEISKSVPLSGRRTSQIPIDNLPPSGMYTQNTNVAGLAPTFGGVAGDAKAPVTGLSRVVLWFSRNDTAVVWNEKWTGHNSSTKTFSGTTMPNTIGNYENLPSGVQMPNLDTLYSYNNTNGTGNYSYILIDRHDPLGKQPHHGHTLPMGFQTATGDLDTSWYVSLNSTLMESGRVTAHYIVYDRAGNGIYYNQKLMILNGVPRISSITLATDIGTNATLQTVMGTGTANVKFDSVSDESAPNGAMARIRGAMGLTTDVARGISEKIPIDTSKPGDFNVVYDQKNFMVRNNLLAIKVDTLVPQTSDEKQRHYRVEYVSGAAGKSGLTLINASGGIREGRVYIINDPGTNFPWGVLGAPSASGASGETYRRGTVFLAMVNGNDIDVVAKTNPGFTTAYGTPSVWELNSSYYTGDTLTRTVPGPLAFNGGSDVIYEALNDPATETTGTKGKTAEFVYRTAAFGTATNNIRDFVARDGTWSNLDDVGRPKDYDPADAANSARNNPWLDYSLFIVKVFDGEEDALFGDFALLSIRVNNNDVTPPYAQVYDLNPKTEREDRNDGAGAQAEALSAGNVGQMGANRTKGGLWNTTGSASSVEKSGHIEPRSGTSLTSTQMGGASGSGTITNPAAQPFVPSNSNTRAYFEYDTVSGDVIVRGYAEDNQRVARVDLEFWSAPATGASARWGAPVTILTQAPTGNPAAKPANGALVVPTALNPVDAPNDHRVKFTETIDLNIHRVEWSYVWKSEELPVNGPTSTTAFIAGNINLRVRAYNAHATPRGVANNTAVTADENVHTNKLITRAGIGAANRTAYDSFNTDFPASTGNFYRYNQIQVNLRPYITGFLRNQSKFSHNVRSRQGRYIFARNEVAVVSGFNLGNDSATNSTTLTLPTSATATATVNATRVGAADVGSGDNQVTSGNQVSAFGLPSNSRTRYRIFAVLDTVVTGEGLVRLTHTSNNIAYQAVNTGTERPTVSGNANRPLAIQPWNKEYSPGKEGSELWDDFTMVHIWRSDATMGNVDRGRFARGAFNITYPSMSIDPQNGRLWASHQEGGRKPTQTHAELYPGGGAYISNNSSTYPYANTDTSDFTGTADGLRQIAAFSEHMTYTSMFVDNSSRVWAATNSITKYSTGNRWRFLPGMWLWGPITNDNNNNGSPMISHFPRTPSTVDTTFHWFPFPNNTGMYAIESLWYNGSTNSRAVAEPPSLEQFHNPHIVTNAASTTAAGTHVHVSYYDSKDGSLKYRYNSIGTTGVVHTDASPRNWVNLDGGADVDDNSDSGTAPGKAAVSGVTQNWTGSYPDEDANNPNNNQDAVNSAYAGGTSYTLQQANNGTTPTNRYLRRVHVQNGSYVVSGETDIYTFGQRDETNTTGTVTVKARATGFIVLNFKATVQNTPGEYSSTTQPAANDPVYRIYPLNNTATSNRIANASNRTFTNIAGRYNSIAVTSGGFPVIAYYDETSQRLKMAVSNKADPTLARDWTVTDLYAVNTLIGIGTGEHVSIQINPTGNVYHIAAMNAITKNLVYITGSVASSTPTVTSVQIVDSVGNVGAWCKLSLDASGNPWIAYMDDGYKGSRDGAKVAYRNTTRFVKGSAGNYVNEDIDRNGTSITGWEAMHVPTQFRVEDAELGMERFPTIRNTGATRGTGGGLATFAAVGFLGEDYYRIAYYVE